MRVRCQTKYLSFYRTYWYCCLIVWFVVTLCKLLATQYCVPKMFCGVLFLYAFFTLTGRALPLPLPLILLLLLLLLGILVTVSMACVKLQRENGDEAREWIESRAVHKLTSASHFLPIFSRSKSLAGADSLVHWLCYGMDELGVVVRFQARARMSFLQSVKTRSGAHLATYVAYRSPSSVVDV